MVEVQEGQEWTDGQFNYIAYRKDDGRMIIRDVEGFDIPNVEEFLDVNANYPEVVEVDMDLEGPVKIARWEAEVGVLPRDASAIICPECGSATINNGTTVVCDRIGDCEWSAWTRNI